MKRLFLLSVLVVGVWYFVVNPRVSTLPQVISNTQQSQITPISLIFTGDLMMDRYIRQIAQTKSYDYILEDIIPLLRDKDLAIVNLEGPITNNNSISIYSEIGSSANYVFTFEPKIVDTLHSAGVDIVNLGNNHILNMGWDGLAQTHENLVAGDIAFFGNTGGTETSRYLLKKVRGITVGFVNYNAFISDGLTAAIEDIREVRKKCAVLIVYTHWGTEYLTTAPEYIQDLAHRFVDEGADLIIGSHPHVVQQSEVYAGKKIYYSLGNFVMDQYFSQETMKGQLVEVYLDPVSLDMQFEEKYVQMGLSGKTILKN